MNLKWRKWYFWAGVRKFVEGRMKAAWFEGGNCDSCCGLCKQWESTGNTITTTSLDDGSEYRECQNCGHAWRAVFTPAGFLPIDSGR